MKEIVALRPKMYSYLTDDDHADKGHKSVIRREIKLHDYKECLGNNKTTRSQ